MEHYNLDEHPNEIKKLKKTYKQAIKRRDDIKDTIPTFQEHLKFLESNPVILGKIRDMETTDTFLKIFFSNFTITATNEKTYRGSNVTFKLKEP